MAPRWQRTKAITAAEFITDRFGYSTQKIYTYLFLLISVFATGAFLYPVAKIVEVSTGIPIAASVIFLGVLILIYTAVGGLWAVIVTDVLQFVVLTAAVLIVVPLSLDRIGGLDNFIGQAPEGFFAPVSSEFSWGFMVAFAFYNLFFIAGNWAYVQRYTSVASPRDAQKVGWLFGGLYIVSPLIWMLPPMIYRVLNPELDGLADEGAYLLMCKEVLPLGLLGLMLGGMVFATSSSVNTTLNISAGVLSNDLYRHFFPDASNERLVKVGRIATIGLGLITILIALLVPSMGGIVEVVLGVGAVTGAALFLPPLWTLFSKYQTSRSVLTVTIVSLVINAFLKFLMPLFTDLKLDRAQEMGVGVGIPIALLFIYELYARVLQIHSPEYSAYQKKFSQKEAAPAVTASVSNQRGGRIIGIGVTATGIMILSLSFIAEVGTLLVAGMGGIVMAAGAVIIYKNVEREVQPVKPERTEA